MTPEQQTHRNKVFKFIVEQLKAAGLRNISALSIARALVNEMSPDCSEQDIRSVFDSLQLTKNLVIIKLRGSVEIQEPKKEKIMDTGFAEDDPNHEAAMLAAYG